jgi:uncharacterized protein (TIGR02246 family)
MKASLAAVVIACLGTCLAQETRDTGPEMAAVTANARAYEAAYAKGDVKALAAFFADDAEYTSDDGRTFSGHEEIEGVIRAAFEANKGGKLAIQVESVRVLAPDVVSEKGSTIVTAKDGESSGALYTAIHVRKDGKWKITQLVETPQPVVAPHDRLSELAWLIGEWEEADKTTALSVHSAYVWAKGGNFITRNVTVKREGATILEGWQIIGWDPIEGRIHSWTFDGEGGFAEGNWTRDGDRWLQTETGATPEGGRISAENTISKIANDRFTWESNNRTLDGEPQPGIGRVEVRRVKGE